MKMANGQWLIACVQGLLFCVLALHLCVQDPLAIAEHSTVAKALVATNTTAASRALAEARNTSAATNNASVAAGRASVAAGRALAAASNASVAAGNASAAAGYALAAAAGRASAAAGNASAAAGNASVAADRASVAADRASVAADRASVAAGNTSAAASNTSVAAGRALAAADNASVAAGRASAVAGNASVAASRASVETNNSSVAAGRTSAAANNALVAAGRALVAAGRASAAAGNAWVAASRALAAASNASVVASRASVATSNASAAAGRASVATSNASAVASNASVTANASVNSTEETLLTCHSFQCSGEKCYQDEAHANETVTCHNESHCELYRFSSTNYTARCRSVCSLEMCRTNSSFSMQPCALDCCHSSLCLRLNASSYGDLPPTTVPPMTTTIPRAPPRNGKVCAAFSCHGDGCFKGKKTAARCIVGHDFCEMKKTGLNYVAGCSADCKAARPVCASGMKAACYQECCPATLKASCLKLDGKVHEEGGRFAGGCAGASCQQ